jgi:hypothetical protein
MTHLAWAALLALGSQEGRGGVAAWDTGTAASEPYSPAQLEARSGWTAATAAAKGDLVVGNGRVVAVFRRKSGSIDLLAPAPHRARLSLEGVTAFESVAIAEIGRGGATVQAGGARFRLKRGDVLLEVEAGTSRLRIECPSRFAILPDFFADDILVDASTIPAASAELPSENFLVQPAGTGDALVVGIFENREQDVRIELAEKRIAASVVELGGKKAWIAVLSEPGIWHSIELRDEDAQKVLPLGWTMPFVASWRCELTRPNGLADSWDMLLQHKKGQEYVKPAWFGGPAEQVNDATRRRFTEVLGFFPYPVWSDPERRGWLQPLKLETRTKFVPTLSYRGPAVIYPFNRVPETPPDRFTFVDLARGALGVGPCEYILDLENQKQEYKGLATCPTRDAVVDFYAKGEQKRKRAEILKLLDDTHLFVVHIRKRIDSYLEFGRQVRAYFAERKKAEPGLAGPIDELDRIVQELDARFEERRDKIQTPEAVIRMNDAFRKDLLDAEGPAALEKVKAWGDALTRIGGNQDKLVSECRWVVRTLRQQAALSLTREPRLAAVAAEIRTRTQAALKNPSMHERARQ